MGEAPTSGGDHGQRKQSKLPKRAKLRRGNSAKRGKPRKAAKPAAAKRKVARAKPKDAMEKASRRIKQPVAPAVEAVAAEVIQQPAATDGPAV